MHFWIDKRSQSFGYNGRPRVAASLSSFSSHPSSVNGFGFGQPRRLRGKSMVTPIHRFPTVECARPHLPRQQQSHQPSSITTPSAVALQQHQHQHSSANHQNQSLFHQSQSTYQQQQHHQTSSRQHGSSGGNSGGVVGVGSHHQLHQQLQQHQSNQHHNSNYNVQRVYR